MSPAAESPTVIRNRRPWFAWGVTAAALGLVTPFTVIAFTHPDSASRGWAYWVSLAACWAFALAILWRASKLAIVDLTVTPGRVEVAARYLHKTVREGFPASRRHRLEPEMSTDVEGAPWHRAVLRTPSGNEYEFAQGPDPAQVEAVVARFADAVDAQPGAPSAAR